jgi:Domain of unknown function (DUF4169)
MAVIINLKSARKAKSSAQRERDAEANRLKFGRTKTEKKQSRANQELTTKKLDGHRRAPEK